MQARLMLQSFDVEARKKRVSSFKSSQRSIEEEEDAVAAAVGAQVSKEVTEIIDGVPGRPLPYKKSQLII